MSELLIEQRSDAWFELRKGKITSSEIYKIMGNGRKEDGLTETAKSYLLERVSEILGGSPNVSYPSGAKPAALEWGTELEDVAIQHYNEAYNLDVQKASFIPVNEHYGGSPDGLLPPKGIIEVKCPFSSANHFKHGLIKDENDFKKVAPNYYYQCMSNIICANADWCDFISFDPRVESKYKMFVYRLHRNQEEVDNINNKLEIAVKYMKELLEKLENTNKVPE
jgi:hypothetical protein